MTVRASSKENSAVSLDPPEHQLPLTVSSVAVILRREMLLSPGTSRSHTAELAGFFLC